MPMKREDYDRIVRDTEAFLKPYGLTLKQASAMGGLPGIIASYPEIVKNMAGGVEGGGS